MLDGKITFGHVLILPALYFSSDLIKKVSQIMKFTTTAARIDRLGAYGYGHMHLPLIVR